MYLCNKQVVVGTNVSSRGCFSAIYRVDHNVVSDFEWYYGICLGVISLCTGVFWVVWIVCCRTAANDFLFGFGYQGQNDLSIDYNDCHLFLHLDLIKWCWHLWILLLSSWCLGFYRILLIHHHPYLHSRHKLECNNRTLGDSGYKTTWICRGFGPSLLLRHVCWNSYCFLSSRFLYLRPRAAHCYPIWIHFWHSVSSFLGWYFVFCLAPSYC